MRLTTRVFLLGIFLTSCAKAQPSPVSAPTTYTTISVTATALPTLIIASTPTTIPTATVQGIKVNSNNSSTFLDGFIDHANSLVWSDDGKKLIISSQQKYLVYFDVQSKKVNMKSIGDSIISSIALSPDKKTLAVISASSVEDNIFVRFINLETDEIITTIKVEKIPYFDGEIRVTYGGTGTFAPDGKTFILNSSRQITLWDVASGNQIKELFKCDPNFFVSGVFLNPAKNLLFTIYFKKFEWFKEKTFLRWNTNTWKLEKTFTGDFSDFSFSPDGNIFTPISNETRTLDINEFTKLLTFTDSNDLGLYSGEVIAYDSSGKYVAVSDYSNGYVTLYNSETRKIIQQLVSNFRVQVLEFSPDGTKLAAGGGVERPGAVIIWDLNQP